MPMSAATDLTPSPRWQQVLFLVGLLLIFLLAGVQYYL
jgi:hypothetical protein